ncbi:MAG: putative ribosome production factor 1 [Streblomastix strix]|uniref:Putative ribosome production factor 1 n=1 Tax=Streblomastix strix TaxID=222440 RepID=A0A5J4UGM2_9EUKA|nr:MAG: putative ribosome production factor 1 [Streblomastix strix]
MVKHQAKKAERPVKKHHQKLQVPKTIDNMRVIDETMRTEETKAEDDEEDLHDEFQDVLSGRVPSKVMITTTIDADVFAEKFGLELQNVIPNSIFRKRRRYSSKEIVDSLKEVNYTSLIIVEQGKIKNRPDGLWIVALPRGPTFRYRLRSVIYQKEIKGGTNATRHFPELNLHGFKTQLGHRTERMFQSLFPQKPDLEVCYWSIDCDISQLKRLDLPQTPYIYI